MQIIFGWGLDRAPRAASRGAAPAIVVGPQQLVDLLLVRLGLGRPLSSLPVRVAQYRTLMEQANHPWYRESFAKDPWNTARQVLTLRDEAVRSGWNPSRGATRSSTKAASDDDRPDRVAALQAIESRVRIGSIRDLRATLAPGHADDLREVISTLRQLTTDQAHDSAWPLGIDSIELADDVDALPPEWRELFDLLSRCGVSINPVEADTGEATAASLTITRGRDEWSTAESAARLLASLPDHESVVVLATGATDILDQQLYRRGLPTLGLTDPGAVDPASQLLPLFLSAIIPPLDVRSFAELLAFRAHTRAADSGGTQHAAGLVPWAARTALLDALAAEPGVSSDPESAWMRALTDLEAATREDDPAAQRAWDTARMLDELVRTDPLVVNDDRIQLDRLLTAVEWLAQRLRALGGGDPSLFVSLATGHLESFLTAIRLIGSDNLLFREVFDIVDACAPQSAAAAHPALAAPWTVVTDPAHIPPGTRTVVWWSAHSGESPRHTRWDDDEIDELQAHGAQPTSEALYERLDQTAALRGLAQTSTLIASSADTTLGAEQRLHPALVQTAERFAQTHPDLFGSPPPPVDAVLTHPAVASPLERQSTHDGWTLRTHSLPLKKADALAAQAPQTISRTVTGDFTHLLPETLSYSQISTLLTSPLEWTLQKGLRLRSGFTDQVPTGSRMIGTLVHAVVQHLVDTGLATGGAVPAATAIGDCFDRLVPRYASELLLPGNQTRLATLRSTTIGTVRGLFSTLADRGLRITAAEAAIDEPLTLTIAGAHRPIRLKGSRDLVGEFADGRTAVLDLKWTRRPKTYRTAVDDDEAVQLSIYGQVTGTSAPGVPPLTAYYLLQQGAFVSSDRDLDPESGASGDPAHLWPCIQQSVEHALSRIVAGHFDALASDAYLETETAVGDEKKPFKDAIEEIRDNAAADGRLHVDARQAYSDFTLILGLTGDYS